MSKTKRIPKCKIFLIALYARKVKGMKTFTSRQLYDLGPEAKLYYGSKVPESVLKTKLNILKCYGHTLKSWNDLLSGSGSFYFSPSIDDDKCNREIQKLITTRATIINSEPYFYSYCRALIRIAIKTGWFNYVDTHKRPYTYEIRTDYVNCYPELF